MIDAFGVEREGVSKGIPKGLAALGGDVSYPSQGAREWAYMRHKAHIVGRVGRNPKGVRADGEHIRARDLRKWGRKYRRESREGLEDR